MIQNILPRSRWRRSALAFSIATFFSFLINLAFLIWAITQRSDTIRDGVGTVWEGSCSDVTRWNTGLHVVINILATILLAGSNFCMQCLMAPTRTEINKAHRRQNWLDVGIPSIRNFWIISLKRKFLWVLLSASSLPIHLLFNSVVFSSISTNEYCGFIVNKYFLGRDEDYSLNVSLEGPYSRHCNNRHEYLKAMHAAYWSGKLEQLSREECIRSYANDFQSSRGNLLIISPEEFADGIYLVDNETVCLFPGGGLTGGSFEWMCSQSELSANGGRPCKDRVLENDGMPEQWEPFGIPLQECHSQRTNEHCRLRFGLTICWVVTALNLLKGILMLLVAFNASEKPVLTIGDAVASFLEDADPSTENMCLASRRSLSQRREWNRIALAFDSRPQRKFAAASLSRWITNTSLYIVGITACASILSYGFQRLQSNRVDNMSVTRFGLGEISADNTINIASDGGRTGGLLLSVIIANSPHVIMSLLYFTYNALFTSVSLVTEWNRFGHEHKGLRVSSTPQGDQRESYFLQLPLRYSIPITFLSTAIHWFISQSIFLVNLEVYAPSDGDFMSFVPTESSIETCGWSPLGTLCVILASSVMIVLLLASGSRRLKFGGMPVAGSCSAAISAACHPGKDEAGAWVKKLRWGVVAEPRCEPRHCSFSSKPVNHPVQGQLYA